MNSVLKNFRITIFGASHNDIMGIVIDGMIPGVKINVDEMIEYISRRTPKHKFETTRIEKIDLKIVSGIYNGYTTKDPICINIYNKNIISSDYNEFIYKPRPGHGDYSRFIKSKGYLDIRGGGMASGRMTILLQAASFVSKYIKEFFIETDVISILDSEDKDNFLNLLDEIKKTNDSAGGKIKVKIKNTKLPLGEPFFDSFESILSHLIFSIPGVKGIIFGSDPACKGSEYNDSIIDKFGKTNTNNCGGINAGILNNNDIEFTVLIRPSSSIKISQKTYNFKENKIDNLLIKGRHDACFIYRVCPVIEAVCQLVLLDFYLEYKKYE